RDQAKRRFQELGLSKEQADTLIPIRAPGRHVDERDPIKIIAQDIIKNDLSPEEINEIAYELASSAPTTVARNSRLNLLRKKLRSLGADYLIIEATKIPFITEEANQIQARKRIDHNSNAFKALFFRNLIPDNKKKAVRFGVEKPIKEIVEHLDNVSNTFNEFKSIIERTIQGPDSVKHFYSKLKWHSKLIGYNNNEVFIKQQFLRGLSPENQIEARRCGLELPLDELVEKLSKIENIRKI
ncbi:2961_t:CDS:2, partial [Paraglomus occultum]